MPYVIEQTKGYLADKAAELQAAMRAGDVAQAQAIYQDVTGDSGAILNSTWWLYCAAGRIRSYTGLSQAQYHKIYTDMNYPEHWTDTKEKHLCHEIIKAVSKQYPGDWTVYWEY